MASKKHQPTKEQIGEAVDTLTKWFPEDAASFKRHRSAIVNHIYEGTNPSSDSELSTLKLQKSQLGASSQIKAFSLPERSQLGVSSQVEAFSLPERSQLGASSQMEAFSLSERSQLGVSSQVEAFSLPERSQLGASSQMEAFSLSERSQLGASSLIDTVSLPSQLGASSLIDTVSLPKLTPCQEACGYIAVDVVFFVIDLVSSLHIPISKKIKRAILRELGPKKTEGTRPCNT